MFLKHPDRKQPLASGFLKHRVENEWFEGELSRLINREDPALPIGILMVMNDFSESFPYQFKDKISQQIYDKQPVMLAPTPCLFTYTDNNDNKQIALIVINFLSEDSKHSSERSCTAGGGFMKTTRLKSNV